MNRISSLFNFIASKIGNVTTLQTKPALKYYFFSTGSRSWPAGASSFTVQIPTAPTGYAVWAMHPRSTNRNVTFVLAFSSGQITINAYNASSAAVTGVVNGYAIYLNTSNALTL